MVSVTITTQKHKSVDVAAVIILLVILILLLLYIFLPGLLKSFPLIHSTDNTVKAGDLPVVTAIETTVPVTPDPEIAAQKQREADFAALQTQVQQYLTDHKLYMLLDLQGDKGESWLVNAAEKNNGLSSIKIYVMVAVYYQIDKGKMTMNTHVARYGFSGTVSQALNAMVHQSSNEATGSLILGVGGTKTVNNILKVYLGDDMSSSLTHTPGYLEGGYNVVTMSEEMQIMQLLEQGKIIDADESTAMLSLMYGTDDYYSLKSIPGVKAVAQKIADAPNTQFGVVAKVDTTTGRSYTLTMQLWRKDGKSISISNLKDIVALMQSYFGKP